MILLKATNIESGNEAYLSDLTSHKKTRFTTDVRLARKFSDMKFARLWFAGHYGNDLEMDKYCDFYLLSISREIRLA